MLIHVLKSKLHGAVVTKTELHYQGSISIDTDLLERAQILPNEVVSIWNINNGERFDTYVIPAARHSGEIGLNGAAARRVQIGDVLIIASFCYVDRETATSHTPTLVILNERDNRLAGP